MGDSPDTIKRTFQPMVLKVQGFCRLCQAGKYEA